jgi:hypothetical protein
MCVVAVVDGCPSILSSGREIGWHKQGNEINGNPREQ